MAIDLVQNCERFYFSNHHWEETLLLAKEHGWLPLDAPALEWERCYFSNDGYTISDRDARTLADALTLALRSVPHSEKIHLQKFIAFCQKGGFRIE
ncbi:MAG: hypothetical protein ACK42Y_07685 [Candidatus Thermochlorobacter sp.]